MPPPGLIGVGTGKTDAVAELARRAGVHGADPYDQDLTGLFARLDADLPARDQGLREVAASAIEGATETVVFAAGQRRMTPPDFRNGRPDSFPATFGTEHHPAFDVVTLPAGWLLQLARAPVAIAADGRSVVRDYSSRYAGLVRRYDVDVAAILADAPRVDGPALALCDDISPLNYCHWLVDTLPRLTCLHGRHDVAVIVSDQFAGFVAETLGACGLTPARTICLRDFQAIRADTLIVPRDCRHMPHPAYKAAPWALDFLRSRIGMTAFATRPGAGARRLYVSRDDATGRRVLNEDALMRLLAPLGYERVTLSGCTVAEQAALFASASHVIGLHGAGLANIVFSAPGARLLEILPASYGMPSFYVLAAGGGVEYASYVAHDVRSGTRPQVDDVAVDIGDFLRCCRPLL